MKQIAKRLLETIVVLLGVILLIFIILRVVPGDPVTTLLGEHVNQETVDRLTKTMHLDRPILEQFFLYVGGLFRGDMGQSYKYNRPVTQMIMDAFPYTLALAIMASIFAWVLGLVLGIFAAVKQNHLLDHLFMGISLFGVSMPVFMAALFLQYLFAFKWKILPLKADGSFLSMILPAIALGWNSAGSVARITRSSLLEAMQADYIDTAKAKGLLGRAVIMRHALKNSMLPVITMMALQLSSMLSGAVISETVFAIPGIGRLATSAIENRDMPVLQGTVIFTTVIVIVGNFIADILYSVLDPRIRKAA